MEKTSVQQQLDGEVDVCHWKGAVVCGSLCPLLSVPKYSAQFLCAAAFQVGYFFQTSLSVVCMAKHPSSNSSCSFPFLCPYGLILLYLIFKLVHLHSTSSLPRPKHFLCLTDSLFKIYFESLLLSMSP